MWMLGGVEEASAHLVNTGLGPIYDGISHFVLSPETMLGFVAIALLGALTGIGTARVAVFAAMTGWIVGSLLGVTLHWSMTLIACTVVPLLLGVAVALEWKPSNSAARMVAFLTGTMLGIASGSALGEAGLGLRGVLGTFVPCFVLLSIVAAVAVGAHSQWSRTLVRVAGSWIAAMSLLMVGWLWRVGG
jgi:hypothetical protein